MKNKLPQVNDWLKIYYENITQWWYRSNCAPVDFSSSSWFVTQVLLVNVFDYTLALPKPKLYGYTSGQPNNKLIKFQNEIVKLSCNYMSNGIESGWIQIL